VIFPLSSTLHSTSPRCRSLSACIDAILACVEQEGEGLTCFVQSGGETCVAVVINRTLSKREGVEPKMMITQKWKAYDESDGGKRFRYGVKLSPYAQAFKDS